MADFSVSFRKGIEAARVADKNREEIASVLQALNEQITRETEGKVAIRIEPRERKTGLAVIDFLKPLPIYKAIVAYNPQVPKSPVKELAQWSQDQTGYPCKITFNFKEILCEDKEALEAGFAELLEDSGIGAKLYSLMQLQADVNSERSAESGGEQDSKQTGNGQQ